jgi:transketolase
MARPGELSLRASPFTFGPRRGVYLNAGDAPRLPAAAARDLPHFDWLDGVYRSLCAILYNYVPGSGHPGGSISSGRIVQAVLFDALDYDLARPDALEADVISYAAGHKALGLYALWALRNEIARLGRPEMLPDDERQQLRLEDLLGFRRNPVNDTPLFRQFGARALDGHPTPATPFVRLATGASGVGIASSFGVALAALDVYRSDPPRVHVIEGEGGMTPGRVAEAFAAAATMGLRNLIVHIDWNQASIDSERVCREGDQPGDYVQWNPAEFAWFHDWNVVYVPDGFDFGQILHAQRLSQELDNGQPTAIVYRTVKGWSYGIEGRASHGAGHKLCASGFYDAVAPLLSVPGTSLPKCEGDEKRCRGCDAVIIEECFWQALQAVRGALSTNEPAVDAFAARLAIARSRLGARARAARRDAPDAEAILTLPAALSAHTPPELALSPGAETTLRGTLGDVLGYLGRLSNGAVVVASADLAGSTSVVNATRGFPSGYFHATANPDARLLTVGGICEDAAVGLLTGLASAGAHLGVASSYAAFLAPLGHIAARLHAIGGQARRSRLPDATHQPVVLVCAHAGLKTGEDGPTHADPQALQLLQDNFPPGAMVTLTPWDPNEIWPLMVTALGRRPAAIAPFVTRPTERIIDRAALGLAPAANAVTGMYALREADPARPRDGTIVLQGSEVAYAFIDTALPLIDEAGFNLQLMYVSSSELFDTLDADEQARIYPGGLAAEAMGITGFTVATMYRWIVSPDGRARSLHPFRSGHYPGSGAWPAVLREAGLDGLSQFNAIVEYVRARRSGPPVS